MVGIFFWLILKAQKLVVGNTLAFLLGKSLSFNGHTHDYSPTTHNHDTLYSKTNHTHTGYASTGHKHAAGDITSGTLGVARGGTGVTSYDALKSALGVSAPSKPVSPPGIGGSLNLAAYEWIVVHQDANYRYLMTKYVIGSSVFGSSTAYASSQVLMFCNLFGAALGVTGNEAFGEFTNDGVKGYCHIPTYAQMNGGFSYFNSNARRIGTDASGNAVTYWTSSPFSSGYVYFVDADGSLYYSGPGSTYGFRPCVALKL